MFRAPARWSARLRLALALAVIAAVASPSSAAHRGTRLARVQPTLVFFCKWRLPMSTYAGADACTDTILDFIAGGVPGNPRGESDGNYSAYFGHIHGTTDFSRCTLAEIYRFQAKMLEADPRSTAVGRYQILHKTLAPLQEAKRLGDDALFTDRLQDEFAVSLLVRRGYRDWWRGAITDREFAHKLSLEWASLPDPENGGRSHYDGDGLNSASTTLAAVYAMLKRARTMLRNAPTATAPLRKAPTAATAAPAPAPVPVSAPVPSAPAPAPECQAQDPGGFFRGLVLAIASRFAGSAAK